MYILFVGTERVIASIRKSFNWKGIWKLLIIRCLVLQFVKLVSYIISDTELNKESLKMWNCSRFEELAFPKIKIRHNI